MKLKAKLASISAAVMSLILLSISAQAAYVWLSGRHPINIRTNANFIGFQTTEPVQNPASCPNNDFYAVPSAYDSKAALAVLLAANLAGKTVGIFIVDNLCDTTSGRPVVTDLQMEQ